MHGAWTVKRKGKSYEHEQTKFMKNGSRYSRMDQVNFAEDRQPLKNLKWYGLLENF